MLFKQPIGTTRTTSKTTATPPPQFSRRLHWFVVQRVRSLPWHSLRSLCWLGWVRRVARTRTTPRAAARAAQAASGGDANSVAESATTSGGSGGTAPGQRWLGWHEPLAEGAVE